MHGNIVELPPTNDTGVNRAPAFPLRLKILRRLGRQTWIPHGRERMLRLCCDPDRCQPYRFEVDFFGLRYRGDLSDLIDWTVFMYGSMDYAELSLLQEVCAEMKLRRKSAMFFDIGANRGHHTLFMSKFADRVFAFEPFPDLRARIEEKISLNRLQNVEILPVALGRWDEELDYFPSDDRNSGKGTLLRDHGAGFKDPVKVTVRNGDQLIIERGLPRLDIVKIDTEGFEKFVLQGLAEHIRKDQPVILMELSDASRSNLSSEQEFRELFYDGALFAEVRGRAGCRFHLAPFNYATAWEVVVFPPEWADFFHTLYK